MLIYVHLFITIKLEANYLKEGENLDRRTKKTQKAIKEAFLYLLQQKPINKITISEITDRADIGRGTFYIHYTDIFDLQNKIIDETIADLERIFDTAYPEKEGEDFAVISERLIQYIAQHRQLFEIFYSSSDENRLTMLIKKIFIKKIIEQENLKYNDPKDQIEVYFFIAGITGVLTDWITGTIKADDETVIQVLKQMMQEY